MYIKNEVLEYCVTFNCLTIVNFSNKVFQLGAFSNSKSHVWKKENYLR